MSSKDRPDISRGRLLRAAAAGAVSASGLGALAACMRGGAGTSLLPSSSSEALRGHGVLPASSPWDQEKVTLRIVNKTKKYPNDQIFWLSTAQNFNGKFVHLTKAGKWELCKASDIKADGPLKGFADYNISLAESGAKLTLPWANSGLIYFCMGDRLKLGLTIGSGGTVTGLAAPAAQNPHNPNFKYLWDKIEYSFNPPGVKHSNFTANTTLITKIALPISVRLDTSAGEFQEGGVVKPGGQKAMYAAFQNDPVFKQLVVAPDGNPIRVIGPSVGYKKEGDDKYAPELKKTFDKYIELCKNKYTSKNPFTATFDGVTYSCYFEADDRIHVEAPPGKEPTFTFGPVDSTSIWLCPGSKIPTEGLKAHIVNIIYSAFNRGILLNHAQQPFCDAKEFYKNEIGLNVWCKTIHDNFVDSKVYAFPYDDQCGKYSSAVSFAIPPDVVPTVTWTITLEEIDWF